MVTHLGTNQVQHSTTMLIQTNTLLTRNQYASPPEGSVIPAGHVQTAEAIITISCVVEGFVTQRPKNAKIFLIFFLNFAKVVPGK